MFVVVDEGTEMEELDEGRPRAGEGIENAATGTHVASQQRLDELWDELAEVGMEPMDVLRALALRELGFRPRELKPVVGELAVQRGLRRRNEKAFDAGDACPTRAGRVRRAGPARLPPRARRPVLALRGARRATRGPRRARAATSRR
jgi:hypothetical protein